ncbi:hypothetical protein [Nostoc sp.]|uniref:hypothetical protein n=1 Tax=Nostoc sp. TaxID=1180 RepID=UPI002FF83840
MKGIGYSLQGKNYSLSPVTCHLSPNPNASLGDALAFAVPERSRTSPGKQATRSVPQGRAVQVPHAFLLLVFDDSVRPAGIEPA